MINPLFASTLKRLRTNQMFASMEVGRPMILIVDDAPENLQVLATILESRGYDVSIASSGAIALASISDLMPDLVLLDICMPHMDGYEVCKQLKASPKTSSIPVIFLSVLDDIPDKVRAFDLGGADYIIKPFHVDETLARIEHQIRMGQVQRQLETTNRQLRQEVQNHQQMEQHLEQVNITLAQEVSLRRLQLQRAHDFEATLKRITDRVRDSLDEHQILRAVVHEVAQAMNVAGCNASLYDLNQQISTISYEYADSLFPLQGRVLQMRNFPEIYDQLLKRQTFQFCSLIPNPERGQVAMLACPILEEQRVLGDLWVIRQSHQPYSEQDIRLVQQVANQCAIALRQARLYQSSLAQVQELERLNQLKDDFLSTISHELRTPMANIKMAAHMLTLNLPRAESAGSVPLVWKYLDLLRQECEREITLINDLLDLSQLDVNSEPLMLTTTMLQAWIPRVVEPFLQQIQQQQQRLQLDIPSDLPAFTTDYFYLEDILRKLLSNACKYTPKEGTIRVSARAWPGRDGITLSIWNSGIEIPLNEQSRIFERFYRIPSPDPWKYGGTGLGLALVKKRVECLQGTVEVSSGHQWTAFTVRCPHCPEISSDL